MRRGFVPGVVASLWLSVAASAGAFELRSTDVSDGKPLSNAQVYSGFGCTGENLSPALSWTRAPAGTKSFALTVFDPDAPTGSGWWHWIVYDLPPATTTLARGIGHSSALPDGAIEARNDFGVRSFGGACPPAGDKPHRYVFTIHALKVDKLEVPLDASAALVGFMINANQIGKASITARYRRR
jgi:Raf kinase inhibitor-like YbhB/YbcL family protein